MARFNRQNRRKIDPRYFLEETTNRDEGEILTEDEYSTEDPETGKCKHCGKKCPCGCAKSEAEKAKKKAKKKAKNNLKKEGTEQWCVRSADGMSADKKRSWKAGDCYPPEAGRGGNAPCQGVDKLGPCDEETISERQLEMTIRKMIKSMLVKERKQLRR